MRPLSLSLIALACLCAIPHRVEAQQARQEKAAIIALCEKSQLDCTAFRLAIGTHRTEAYGQFTPIVQADVTKTNGFHSISGNGWVRQLNLDWKCFHDARTDPFRIIALTHLSADWMKLEAQERGRK